jgi:predicted RNA-binding protein associated with RNAse of E/G family
MSMARSVRVEMRKWPDSPHWEFDTRWLGADAVGQWLGLTTGTWMARPGVGMHAVADHVVLVPHDAWWVGTFYGEDDARPFDTYVDIATPAVWDGDTVRCVDLDLDVIRGTAGRVWVDDEDEFAEHRVTLDYPVDLVEGALASCASVLALVEEDAAPFTRAHAAGWLAKLRSL